jgi:hypothetical protein
MSDKQTLLQKFKRLKADYTKSFKAGLIGICRKIGDQLMGIAEQLREQGLTFEGLGLSADGQYIVRCIDSARTNPSDHSETLLNDAERLLEESIPIQHYTMRGFEVFEVDSNGKLSIPEPKPPKKSQQQPFRPPLRNCDIQREAGEN